MSFICNMKKVEVSEPKFIFHERQKILEENIATADNTIKTELIQQNINFLKRLEKKLNPKVRIKKQKNKNQN